jgi:hypothetical protein
MHDQASAPAAGLRADEAEFAVLALLLELPGPAQWSLRELALELGCERQTARAVAALRAAGLVHCCEEFVFASRAAVRFRDLLCAEESVPALPGDAGR